MRKTCFYLIFLVILSTLLVALDKRPLFGAFIWDKNRKEVEELKIEVKELKDIIIEIREDISGDTIRKSVQEGSKLLIEKVENFNRQIEILQNGLLENKVGLEDDLQAWKADLKADINESIQNIRMEIESSIGRAEVGNTNAVGNLQRSLDDLSKRLEDWEKKIEDRDKETAALNNRITEEAASFDRLLSEGLNKRDKEIDSIKSTLKMHSEDRDSELSILESTLTKNLVERDKEIISLISNIQNELEKKEEGFNALKETLDNIHERLNLLDQRLSSLETAALKPPPVEEKDPAQHIPEDEITEKGAGRKLTEPEITYSKAKKAIKDKDYNSALQILKDFLVKYPDAELSDNAQYWIGEVYYAQKDFSNAILAFDEVVNKYPEGDKIPDALLKEGLSFYNLGKLDIAKIFLDRVKEEYPETRFSSIAAENLKKITERSER